MGFMHSYTTLPAPLFPNWLIQVCLSHTWINQFVQIWQTANKGAGSSAAVHKANWVLVAYLK